MIPYYKRFFILNTSNLFSQRKTVVFFFFCAGQSFSRIFPSVFIFFIHTLCSRLKTIGNDLFYH